MDTVKAFAGPITTLIGAAAPVAASFINKPTMPNIKSPTPVATPTMPSPDDDAARAASLKAVAARASSHGRSSTNLYEKEHL